MATPVQKLKEQWMKEPGFRDGYDALASEFELAGMLIEARTGAKLSQLELAQRMGTSQSTVARLESGTATPTLSTLKRFAAATGCEVRVTLVRTLQKKPRRTRVAA
jgi:transcriptional regulator with XRE-family HTH domain